MTAGTAGTAGTGRTGVVPSAEVLARGPVSRWTTAARRPPHRCPRNRPLHSSRAGLPCSPSLALSIRHEPMPKVRLSYDGWLALPAAVRKKLGLSTGYQLELELVGGVIVLRPAGATGPAESAVARPPVEALPPEPPPAAAP